MNGRPLGMAEPVADMLQLLSVPRTAELLDCSVEHVYRLINAGDLPTVQIRLTGSRSKARVRLADLRAFIDARTAS